MNLGGNKRTFATNLMAIIFDVMPFKRHQPDQYPDRDRWAEDCQLESQSFLTHVHKYPDDTAGFHHHEGEN